MARSTSKDAQDLFRVPWSAYSSTPINLKIVDLYVMFAVFTALIQEYFLAQGLQFWQDLAPERAFVDFVLCNLVLHLVIMNFLG